MSSNGLTQGNFTLLNVLKDGVMQDVTTFAGGGGAVNTASAPLSISAGDISLDTSGLLATSAECAKIGSAAVVHPHDFKATSVTLTSPDASDHQLSADDTGRLIVAGNRPLLANSITVGAGMFALASNPNGFLSLALTGSESRAQLRLLDPATTVRELTSNVSGELLWDGAALPTAASVATQLAAKQDDLQATVTASTLTFNRTFRVTEATNHPTMELSVPGGVLKHLAQPNLNCGIISPGQYFSISNQAGGSLPILCNGADVTVGGTLSATVKNFLIPHPDKSLVADEGKEWKLRHWDTESSEPGGQVLERRKIDMTSTTATFEMPSYFRHLVKDVTVHCTPYGHFGSAWGEYEDGVVTVRATTLGEWHVIIMATRDDENARAGGSAVEFQQDTNPTQ